MDRPWPYSLSRMAEAGKIRPAVGPISLLVVGFATDNAKHIDVWERIIAVPSSGCSGEASAAMIRQWQKEGSQLEKRLGRSKTQGAAAVAAIRPHVEARVSARADQLLAGGHDAWGQAAREYSPLMAAIAKSLSPGFTTAATQRRQQIAEVVPDMRAKTGPARKSTRKKGGGT
jgi:hypothetical protein